MIFGALFDSYSDTSSEVAKAAEKAAFKNFGHAAARIRKDAAESIQRSAQASMPGAPPHTRRGHLKRAFRFDRTKDDAVIGPRGSIVGESASAHEFGGQYKGQQFPERPFMGPALEKNLPRFADDWAGSLGG